MFIELGFWPPGWDLGLQVGIWATRQELGLGFKSKGGRTEKKEEKEKEEKIPHICESIGHRPLRAAAQNGKKECKMDEDVEIGEDIRR